MAPGFAGLDVALRALRVQQKALEVTSQNIANASTEGYTRRRVSITSTNPATIAAGQEPAQVGTGADANVERLRDALIDLQVRRQTTARGLWETARDALQQVESVFGEPRETGLHNLLVVFLNGWDELNNDPGSMAARAELTGRAATLADVFNGINKHLRTLRSDMDRQVTLAVGDVNDLADQIARLNGQVVGATGEDSGDLRDQRDRLLDRLAHLVNISYVEDGYGSVTVSLGGRNLVFRTDTTRMAATPDPSNGNLATVEWADGLSSVDVRSGKIRGALDLRDVTLASVVSDLDAIAAAIITNVNALHSSGFGLNGSTGLSFFSGSGASDMAVSDDVKADLSSIAAASSSGSAGDGSNARAISNLRGSLVMNSGTATISDYYLGMIGQLGAQTQRSNNEAETQALIAENFTRKQQEVSGVSLDEEAINLVRYQRAYQAAARVVNIMDELLEKVVNSLGLVGR